MDFGSARRIPRLCSRAVVSLKVIGTMAIMEEEDGLAVKMSIEVEER